MSTVSHVINGYSDIKESTRRRVLKAIEELDYHPNAMARSLLTGRSHMFGVLLNGHESLMHPFLNQIIMALALGFQEAGYGIALAVYEPNTDVHTRLKTWREQRVEGVVAIGFAEDHPMVQAVVARFTPAVFIDTQLSGANACWVASDNRSGARQAVTHLLGLGHRRIAFVQGIPHGDIIRDRYKGYLDALANAGVAADDSLYDEADFSKPGAYQAANRLLSRTDLTAVFCASDLMALGVMACVHDRGLRVPDDVAVVGFDDIAAAEHVTPPLTTVRQPGWAMGRTAVGRMLEMVDKSKNQVHEPTLLPVDLIIRGSCGTVRARAQEA